MMGTTKKRFIELHGEEAWEIESKRRNEKAKEYRINNLDRIRDYKHQWYLDNFDRLHFERTVSRKEEIKEYNLNYKQTNKEEINKYKLNYNKTKKGRAVNLSALYKVKDNNKGFDTSNNINYTWIIDNIFSGQKCYKCGETDWTKLGCDRIDNNKPHTPDNVLCCCYNCNVLRGDKYTVEEYLSLPMKAVINSPRINIGEDGSIKKLRI